MRLKNGLDDPDWLYNLRSKKQLELALKTIGIAIFSISMLISFGLTSNQAFAGESCEDCDFQFDQCTFSPEECRIQLENCRASLQCRDPVGGDMIQMETTSILAAGAQYTAAWMIPTLIAAAGIGIVIARKI